MGHNTTLAIEWRIIIYSIENEVSFYIWQSHMIINKERVVLLKEYKLNTVVRSLQEREYVTPRGYHILYSDVKDAIRIMNKKHYACEWVNYDTRNPKINLEGQAESSLCSFSKAITSVVILAHLVKYYKCRKESLFKILI